MKRSILSVLGVFLALAFLVSCENNESPESPICEIVVESDGEGAVASLMGD